MYYTERRVPLPKRCDDGLAIRTRRWIKQYCQTFFRSIRLYFFYRSTWTRSTHMFRTRTDFSASTIFFHVIGFYTNGNDEVGSTYITRVTHLVLDACTPQNLDWHVTCIHTRTHIHIHIHDRTVCRAR